MVLGILIIPIATMDYVIDRKIEYALENPYAFSYEPMELEYIDLVQNDFYLNNVHSMHDIIGSNQSYLLGLQLHQFINWDREYTNNITPLGNDTYAWDISNYTYSDSPLIGLNMTNHELANYDTILVKSTAECLLIYYDSGNINDNIEGILIDTDTYLFIINIDEKINLLSLPDSQIFFSFDNLDLTGNFQMQKGIDIGNTTLSIDDSTYYYIALSISICLSIFTVVFLTDSIDIIIDYKDDKKNKWRK